MIVLDERRSYNVRMKRATCKAISSKKNVALLYRAVCSTPVLMRAVSDDESRNLRRYCSGVVRKLNSEATTEYGRGRKTIYRRIQAELLQGHAARLLAAYTADLKFVKRERRNGLTVRRLSFREICILAANLKNIVAPACARVRRVNKSNGGYRLVYSCDRLGIAKQALFVNAIKPFASFHHSQFALRRGRSAACESLLRNMNDPSACNTRFIQFDVSDYFGSISREYIEEIIPAPKAVIRNTLFMYGWRISSTGLGDMMPDRRGLPQGSAASSFVAEWVMANVIRDLADQLAPLRCLHFYSDNWGGFVPHDEDVDGLVDSLKSAFETHRAGPYRLTWSDAGEGSFKFLGYYFEPRKGDRRARASLPKGMTKQKELEFVSELVAADTVEETRKVYARAQAFSAAYSLAPEARRLRKRIERLAFGQPIRGEA